MKKIKYKALISKSTLQAAAVGLMTAIIIFLLNMDSPVLAESHRFSLTYIFSFFPGLWGVLALPFLFAITNYWISRKFSEILRKHYSKIKKEAGRIKQVLAFIEDIRKDKLDTPLKNPNKKDPLTLSLISLREFMVKSKLEQQRRRVEEEQRNWVTKGLAEFGEILRKSSDNLEELSYEIIRYLVNYMKINQGGVFLLEQRKNGDPYFEMTACFAFDRRKYADKIINWGEGLIGRCGLEKETILLTDVPDDYIHITSGLGEANPSTILLVPLKTNDELYGVIELASFKVLEEFEIGLVEKSAESIASTIAMVKTNIQTNKLLRETQIQAEKMAQQEEELRQNLEEMRATQEESDRREVERKGILDAIDHAAISCEFDAAGNLLSVNENFFSAFRYRPEEIEGQNLRIFVFKEDIRELDKVLAEIQNGNNFRGRVRRRTKSGDEIYLLSTYSPVIDHNGNILKILSLENDVTDQVKMEDALKRSKEELGLLLEKARNEMKEQFKEIESVKIRNEKTLEGALDAIITTNQEGVVEFFNAAAEKLWGYERQEILNNNVNMLFSKETVKTNEFITRFVSNENNKIVGERREVPIRTKYGEDISVLMLLSEAEVGGAFSYTAFIQNVEVELF
jgi:PAS domain S-box-containing protein